MSSVWHEQASEIERLNNALEDLARCFDECEKMNASLVRRKDIEMAHKRIRIVNLERQLARARRNIFNPV